LNFELVIESLKHLADELRFIIVDNSSRFAKVVNYVMLDESDHV